MLSNSRILGVLAGISILQFLLYGIFEAISKIYRSPKQTIFTIFGKHVGKRVSPVEEIPMDSVKVTNPIQDSCIEDTQIFQDTYIKGTQIPQDSQGVQENQGIQSIQENQSIQRIHSVMSIQTTHEPQPCTSYETRRLLEAEKKSKQKYVNVNGDEVHIKLFTARLKAIKKLKIITADDLQSLKETNNSIQDFKDDLKFLIIDLLNSDLTISQPFDWDLHERLDNFQEHYFQSEAIDTQYGLLSTSQWKTSYLNELNSSGKFKLNASNSKKSKSTASKSTKLELNTNTNSRIHLDSVTIDVQPIIKSIQVEQSQSFQKNIRLNTQRFNPEILDTVSYNYYGLISFGLVLLLFVMFMPFIHTKIFNHQYLSFVGVQILCFYFSFLFTILNKNIKNHFIHIISGNRS